MPRKARIDSPGAVHHIISRGIERRSIFKDGQLQGKPLHGAPYRGCDRNAGMESIPRMPN
jgi:hypothetical protein